jgi:hypothetical protein
MHAMATGVRRAESASCVIRKWPNVEGNRPADEMRTENQGMCRRVRLTVRLGRTRWEAAR